MEEIIEIDYKGIATRMINIDRYRVMALGSGGVDKFEFNKLYQHLPEIRNRYKTRILLDNCSIAVKTKLSSCATKGYSIHELYICDDLLGIKMDMFMAELYPILCADKTKIYIVRG